MNGTAATSRAKRTRAIISGTSNPRTRPFSVVNLPFRDSLSPTCPVGGGSYIWGGLYFAEAIFVTVIVSPFMSPVTFTFSPAFF